MKSNLFPLPSVLNPDGSINAHKAALLAGKIELERKHNFATVDPATCEHSMVYSKDGDAVHCHFCDRFMYYESKD